MSVPRPVPNPLRPGRLNPRRLNSSESNSDTPAKHLFAKALRAFSHGCVRVQHPFDLAEVLLGRQGMRRDEIKELRASREERVVTLRRRIPVHVTYLTAWVNKDGSVHFRRDVYERDKTLNKALVNTHPRPI